MAINKKEAFWNTAGYLESFTLQMDFKVAIDGSLGEVKIFRK